jgi:hypothetical protein
VVQSICEVKTKSGSLFPEVWCDTVRFQDCKSKSSNDIVEFLFTLQETLRSTSQYSTRQKKIIKKI